METTSATIATDKTMIDIVVKQFFDIFKNTEQQPDWSLINNLCIPETIIIKKTGLIQVVYNLATFIEPRKIILTDGTLTGFREWELSNETKIVGNIAQRFSTYEKTGNLNGVSFREHGNKLFQFVKMWDGWKISSLLWEDEIIPGKG